MRTGISVGNRDLATYTYTNDKNFYLEKLEYGNDDSVEYEYDKKGRVTKKTYEDDTYVTYTYGDSGCWTTITDSATGITTTYTYDYLGRLRLYEEKGTNHNYSLRYSYTDNKLTYIQEVINGYDRGTRYTYDEDDRLVSVLKAGSKRTYNYDDLNRVNSTETTYKTNTVFTTNYGFAAPTGNTASTTSGRIASVSHTAAGYNSSYSYTYDKNGNITSVSDGTNTITYEYDSANQLIRENNPADRYTYIWEYDDAGNILSRTEYEYTTGPAEDLVEEITYCYNDSQWGDLLTSYNDTAITYDQIGNPLTDGTWTYTWQHGRQLASMSKTGTTWNYTYNADGMRTKRTNGTNTYEYVYSGSELVYMSVDGEPLRFSYAAEGTPMSVAYGGYTYFYVTNLQGDVVALLNSSGEEVVSYTYDAWGNILSTTGTMATTLGAVNPLRYRGYVYDNETGLYYLQSRYYDPEIGRFINADGLVSTGQGLLGNNMFAYCGNNPVNYHDPSGHCFYNANGQWCHDNWEYIGGYARKPDPGIYEEVTALNGDKFTQYKNKVVIRSEVFGNSAFSFGAMIVGNGIEANEEGARLLKHEFGHTKQLEEQGLLKYTTFVVIPSVTCFILLQSGKLDVHYYSLPWEYEADVYGGASDAAGYSPSAIKAYCTYKVIVAAICGEPIDSNIAARIGS